MSILSTKDSRVLPVAIEPDTLPFALLVLPVAGSSGRKAVAAQRQDGEIVTRGTLAVSAGQAVLSGVVLAAGHRAAVEQAVCWLGEEANGSYPLAVCAGHRAPVEAMADGLRVEQCAPDGPALALAWVAALVAARTGNPRQALRRTATLFRSLTADEQATLLASLADGTTDAGNLASIYLARVARETAVEELERWESWFLGQRMLDLPYDRKAVVEVLESDIDPDQKRLVLHDVVRGYDNALEAENIARTVARVSDNHQELVFGRMSRAFHNQGLLFANAGYLQVDAALRAQVSDLVVACAGSAKLAPPADRLRMLLQGAQETALTAALGALELLEDAILDDQRQLIDANLKADREGRTPALDTPDVLARADRLLAMCRGLRQAMVAAPRRPAAYVILSQRFSATGSHLFARINEFQEPYLGKAENLKMLVRRNGHRMYASPEYAWLHHADHWIEAIPLFIKERVLVVDGAEVTETVIDQAAMEESFREQLADHWAINIDNVTDSEHVALAREILARSDMRLAGDDRARAAAVAQHGLAEGVGALAAIIADGYRAHAEQVHLRAEQQACSRYDALRATILENITTGHPQCRVRAICRQAEDAGTSVYDEVVAALATQAEAVQVEALRLAKVAHLPRRPLPALHVLTTQSARMSDGYIRTWIEESMALFNVVRAHGLEGEVKARMDGYRRRICELGANLVRELGMWAEVEEIMALENLSEARAVARVVAGNGAISRQVSILAVLSEHYGSMGVSPVDGDGTDFPLVEEILATRAESLQAAALRGVYERNDLELLPRIDAYLHEHPTADEMDAVRAVVLSDPEYADDLVAFTRFAAREEAVRELDRQDASLKLGARVSVWMREHSRLALTTARRETLLAHGLHHLTLHPLYYYRAAGGNKRFHQLYTPSRVDLGTRERESVETWAQWVGGADREAARVGRRIYGLINKNVKMFDSLPEPEVLKTGENASMVSHFSYSNAMSLLVNAVGRGDVEDLGDQMSLRKDRFIHPGGEGYGGYCVPKDGLFLEFVLILTRATKLRQLGIADHLHAGVVAFSHYLLSRRDEFASEQEWETWAMQLVAERGELAPFFTLRGEEAVPVFQITRIARALTQLGRPELTDSFDVLANLAARWGIHKIIVGGEQVNRFMPFYKTWLTYRAVEDAARLNPNARVKTRDFTTVLSAEYKPDTQDGRFSVGMRKFELFAGTGEHLTYSLDTHGQDIAALMFDGFERLWARRSDARVAARLGRLLGELQVREDDAESVARLRELFPGYSAPAEIRMVSPMGLATSDLLHYTSDTSLEQVAQEVRRRLANAGLTDNEISANMQVYGPRLERWTKLRDLPAEELEMLVSRIGGQIHALALAIIGPAGNYEMAVQGADVLDTGIPHRDLLDLLADPVKVRNLMLEGNPGSALVIVDGASGARHRAMNRLAVMRWFAAGEAIGRESIYRCVGVGAETIESWRAEMRRQRGRAQGLFEALLTGDVAEARARYAAILDDLRDGQEAALFLESEERMIRFKKQTAAEAATARALAAIASGTPLEDLDFTAWLALGGQYWLMGATLARMQEVRQAFEGAIAAMGGTPSTVDEAAVSALFIPAYVPAAEEFREEKGIESSNKATEEVVAVAIDTRKRLAERAARARALREREEAFRETLAEHMGSSLSTLIATAHAMRGDGEGLTQAQFGQMQALTRLGLQTFGRETFSEDYQNLALLNEHVETLFTGREFDPLAVRAVAGGYEDPGDIARMGQRIVEDFRAGVTDEARRDARLAQLADVAELFDACRAIDLTIGFLGREAEPVQVWRALADFFAESLNDHFYSYRPWVYSRGIGFSHIRDKDLYALCVAHHTWLYRYLRTVALTCTELKTWTPADVAELLGDMATAAEHAPIGADAPTAAERQWRAYNQLREIAFIRNDGFALPEVFPAFDPAIIHAEARTNQLFLFPVGRTHVSRALMEGPTLSDEFVAQGRLGVNLLISRDCELGTLANDRAVLQAHNAHLYISRAEYIEALVRHRGMARDAAEAMADAVCGPKGVRIAARFTTPITMAVVFPFHRHPKYVSGLLEELGLPYSAQSLFHLWTTYDKAKYPAIFSPETGVEVPGEIDWLESQTAELGEEATRKALEYGCEQFGFPGLREFAQRYRLVMVKDAAESGGRGQRSFTLRHTDGTLDEVAIAEAVEFIYQISLKHNVAVQEVIISSPEYWATEEFMQSFVDRQIHEWGAAVNRARRPRTSLYGSHRLIFSSDDPASGNWHVSHPITLNSRQLITNVGRGGTLDWFRPEIIRPEFRELLPARMAEAGAKVMAALARYEQVAGSQFTDETGRPVGKDATGLSYAVPRYMMLDFLVQPIFAEEGTLVDLEPIYDGAGERTGVRFILQQGEARFAGTVKDWRVVLIEPNIGIGLWDRLALREEAHDPACAGTNARIVLGDLARAGEGYLHAITV